MPRRTNPYAVVYPRLKRVLAAHNRLITDPAAIYSIHSLAADLGLGRVRIRALSAPLNVEFEEEGLGLRPDDMGSLATVRDVAKKIVAEVF